MNLIAFLNCHQLFPYVGPILLSFEPLGKHHTNAMAEPYLSVNKAIAISHRKEQQPFNAALLKMLSLWLTQWQRN